MTDNNLAIFSPSKDVVPTFAFNDGQMGNDGIGMSDVALPQLKVLQPLSPEITDGIIPGAKSGMLCNSVTNELFDSVYVINLDFKKQFSIFKKREKGGGFNGAFDSKEAAEEKVKTLEGNVDDYQVIETAIHSLLLLDAEGKPQTPAIMYFKSTSLNTSRNWNSMLVTEGKGGPRFCTVWTMTSKKNSNSKGTWWTPEPVFAGFTTETLYEAAKDQFNALRSSAA